ncbi:CYTH domain-containing protein [Xylanibacillus composti]|nr:CYTH domain-containing protein [Xylanibacillus composti]
MIERELKSLLTKEEYDNLCRHPLLAGMKTISHIQMNYYYDTADLSLKEQDITLRVRQFEDSLTLEIKQPVEETHAYKAKKEWRFPLESLPSYIDLGHHFPSLDGHRAMLTFPLLTERRSCHVSDHIRIDLDKSSYLGNIDYEIEIEFDENGDSEAADWFHQLLPGKRLQKADGKKTRFFRAYLQTFQGRKGLSLNEFDL